MKKLVLVYNPVSGHATFKNKLDEIIEKFQQRGCMLLVYRTQRCNDSLPEFIRESGAEGVVAAGGDGTLHEVANILVKNQLHLPLAIIGSGTSNDFASYLGVTEDIDAYIDVIAAGRTRKVDLGKCGEEYFVNVASAGMLTSIAHEVDPRLKHSLGKMAYYLHSIGELPNFRAIPLHITADGKEYEERAFFFLAANSGTVAGFKHAIADASLEDGLLDLLLVRQCSLPEFMALAAELVAGRSILHRPSVLHVQAAAMEIVSAAVLDSDLDGELGPQLPLRLEAVPGAMEIYC